MSSFTCLACHVAFTNFEVQREHYKSDWHRYNLKRKVAELPPVSAENFQQRVLAQRSQAQSGNDATAWYCSFCHKSFSSENAFFNHLKSKKHIEAEEEQEQTRLKSTLEKNLKNASNGKLEDLDSPFYVPLVELKKREEEVNAVKRMRNDPKNKSLEAAAISIKAKGAAIGSDSDSEEEWDETESGPLGLEECLFCSYLSSDLESNVKHMTETHSFFIPDVEYLVDMEGLCSYLAEKVGAGNMCLWCNDKGKAFYTTKAAQQHMVDKGHCKMLHEGETLEEYADFYDYSTSYPDHEEADDANQEVEIDTLNDEGFQMVLPSGSVIGHRSLMRYYRQNLPPVRPQANRRLLHTVMSHYRALGWTGMTGEAAMRKARDISLLHMRRSKKYLDVGMKNNKCLQKHFRQQNPI